MERLTGYIADDMLETSKHWMPFYSEKRPTMADIIIDGGMERRAKYKKYYGENLKKSELDRRGIRN